MTQTTTSTATLVGSKRFDNKRRASSPNGSPATPKRSRTVGSKAKPTKKVAPGQLLLEWRRERMDKFSKESEFAKVETIAAKAINGSNLANDIHPVFRAANFLPEQYDLLQTPLRLASRLLCTDRLRPHFHTILDDSDPDRVLTPEQMARVDKALLTLSEMVTFQEDPSIGTNAMTKTKPSVTHSAFPSGCGSIVRYPLEVCTELREALDSQDIPLILWLSFNLAVMFVHEISHVMINARHGDKDVDPFFGDDAIAEPGFQLEATLFGGHITRLFEGDGGSRNSVRRHKHKSKLSKLRGYVVLWEMPCKGIALSYRHHGCAIGVRSRQLKDLDLAFRVDIPFIYKFFTTEFWEEELPRVGPAALRPRRNIGFFFKPEVDLHDGELGWDPQPSEYKSRGLVPAGYEVKATGDVVRSSQTDVSWFEEHKDLAIRLNSKDKGEGTRR